MDFIERFIEIARAHPERIAVTQTDHSLSYRQLYRRAAALALTLQTATTGPLIGLMMAKNINYIVALLAVHISGRTAVALDRGYPIERQKQLADAVDLALCIVDRHVTEPIDLVRAGTVLLDLSEVHPDTEPFEPTGANDRQEAAAYIVFTSGTTGRPKPVMVPYRSLSALIDGMIQPDTVQGCTLFYAAQGFDVSFQEIYSTLCCGHTLHLIEDDIKKDLHILYRTLHDRQVTRLFLPTSMLIPFTMFDRNGTFDLPLLTQILVAGEQLRINPAVRRWFQEHPTCRLINHYGPSETHVVMEHVLEQPPKQWPDLPALGDVLPCSRAFVLNEDLQPVAPGECGRLYIAGRSLALGYYGMPQQTADRFIHDPVSGELMYDTGDICYQDSNDLYHYKGRHDRQHKVRGHRVELKEIEVVVSDSGLVTDCLVVARESGATTVLILYYTTHAADQDVTLALHTHLAAQLPEYMLPSFYQRIAAIPLNHNGKADPQRLPQFGSARDQLPGHYEPPHGPMEIQLCAIAATCLGLDKVGALDNFMELGASSITLLLLMAELRHALGHDLRLTDLYEFPCARHLCAHLARPHSVTPPPDRPLPVSDRRQRCAAMANLSAKRRH
ncbi:non-ribosomal peptide synthetase [Pseudomonas aeruginosa]|uniref:non-ribosomal peptide synthetase n=1 Tax=Pseudomonas aeruginosa TaxID=287 RepID=UPI00053EE925|nr:non-ribosomal peptide synthetase [Pseudomonas aeruginosa]EIU3791057.1 non-ribosomal peptide synthetase [Pseudomonas aeruginosa]EKV0488461.1 non-ribosomal peptide synthetase [Pseudomonas aeruginosa]MBG3917978.1 non-ribosomal peptide synthetase [Pseudomonas aeruginosa]MBG4471982.1 non-ribosomal peptide synthetase [Pseudomonas aeruginosa]MBG6814357.1 non-ribosomal peptide synthetase [Pseudomonas aeruginosa]